MFEGGQSLEFLSAALVIIGTIILLAKSWYYDQLVNCNIMWKKNPYLNSPHKARPACKKIEMLGIWFLVIAFLVYSASVYLR